jgi:hypothetical protein
MNTIEIKQNGKVCELWVGGKLNYSGGRVKAKQLAKANHLVTRWPVYNVKISGKTVLVIAGD